MTDSQPPQTYFLPSDNMYIDRCVITADIQLYLGIGAVAKPGHNEGQPGYWITATRALTDEQLQEMKQDSDRWRMKHGHPTTAKTEARERREGKPVVYEL